MLEVLISGLILYSAMWCVGRYVASGYSSAESFKCSAMVTALPLIVLPLLPVLLSIRAACLSTHQSLFSSCLHLLPHLRLSLALHFRLMVLRFGKSCSTQTMCCFLCIPGTISS